MSKDTFQLKDKVVAITGASSGFGYHFAQVLAQKGAKVVVGARRKDKLKQCVKEIEQEGGHARACELDVLEKESISNFLETTIETYGACDVLINNAGVEAGAKTYQTTEEEDWNYVIDTNLKSAWLASKIYTNLIIKKEFSSGNIIMISSITDSRTIKGQFSYAVSKGGLTRMTEVMALEAAKFNIRVNALAPGYFPTDLSRLLLESPMSKEFKKGIPMRRYGEFPELDGPLLLLASDASRYMTGSVVVVDGGHICSSL